MRFMGILQFGFPVFPFGKPCHEGCPGRRGHCVNLLNRSHLRARHDARRTMEPDEEMVPLIRIERMTYRLQGGCSTS
jgi:hypothetical protein